MAGYKEGWIPKILFLILCSLGFAWLFGLGTPDSTNIPQPFNSRRWKAADLWGDRRCSMILDLQYRVGIVGKSRAEIQGLLGKPEHDEKSTSDWHLCPSFMDIYILEVEWRNDRAISAIVRDT